MTAEAMALKNKIREVISRKEYQPGYPDWNGLNNLHLPAEPGAQKGITWCNAAANAVLVELGFDTRSILHVKGIGWTSAKTMYENAASSASDCRIWEISPLQAQLWANRGIPILATALNPKPQPSHVGIVCPTDDVWNPAAGPFIGQAGATVNHGFYSAFESFKKWGLYDPHYFLLPLKA